MQFQYLAPTQVMSAEGKRYALVEVIDENVSGPVEHPPGARVRINPAGKARALASLLDKPLRGPPELGHMATRVVGRPLGFMSNHATSVLYEIPDSGDWERITRGEWGPVSPTMTPIQAHNEGDILVLDEWVWDDAFFVRKGAWPNAGVKTTCEGNPRLCGFSNAVTAALGDPWRMRDTLGSLVGLPLGQLPPHVQAQRAVPNQGVRRDGKLVEIEAIGSLIGVPLGQTGRARAG